MKTSLLVLTSLATAIAHQQCSKQACDGAESATMLQVGNRRGQQRSQTNGAASSGIHSLLTQSKAMLFEDTTPAVRQYMKETLAEIENDIKPQVRDQHSLDQASLNRYSGEFAAILSTYQQKQETLDSLRKSEELASNSHKECRNQQFESYFKVRACKATQDELFEVFQRKQGAYRDSAKGFYCESNEADMDENLDRQHFESIKVSGHAYFDAWDKYEDQRELCRPKNTTYAAHQADCNVKQVELEKASCESHALHVASWNNLVTDWVVLEAELKKEVESAEAKAESRMNEMQALVDVTCILNKVDERGGKACAEGDEEAVNEDLEECKKKMQAEIPGLTLDIPEVPQKPTMPVTEPFPCTDSFNDAELAKEILASDAIEAEPNNHASAWADDVLAHMAACSPCLVSQEMKHFDAFKLPEQLHEAAKDAKFEVGQLETEDTHPDSGGAFVKDYTFKKPFASKPVVAAVMGSNGQHSAQIQIFDVTTHGFKYAVVEPAGWDGVHLSEKVRFVAAVPGVTEVGGMKVFAGRVQTSHTVGRIFETQEEGQEAEADKVDDQWEEIDFGGTFSENPAVLTSLQTTNNQALSTNPVPKSPWLVVSMKDLTANSAKVTLDRCEVKDGSVVEKAEEVGYIAIAAGSGEIDGIKFSVKHQETSGQNMGWDDVKDGLLESIEFHEDIPEAVVVASKSTREGIDGGWIRIFSQDDSSVKVVVDEDISNDAERKHISEDVSVAVFSAPFSYPH